MIAARSGCCLRLLGVVMNEQLEPEIFSSSDFTALCVQYLDIIMNSVHALRTLMVEFMRFG
jgi:hypothetical protein